MNPRRDRDPPEMEGSPEARLRALEAELHAKGFKTSLPSRLPSEREGLGRLAARLLHIYHQHHLGQAYEIMFDLLGEAVAEQVVTRLEGTAISVEPEELTAQVFFQLHEREPEPGTPFWTWVDLILDRLLTRSLELANPDGLAPDPTTPFGPAHAPLPFPLSLDEAREIIWRSLSRMPETTQRCLYLHVVERRSYPDIAHLLRITLTEVSRRISEARRIALGMAREWYRERDEEERDEPDELEMEGDEP
ncbi:MAG: sigma factor-like helix-turn-helix DNA-binding protein [Planctomycetota bacterium]